MTVIATAGIMRSMHVLYVQRLMYCSHGEWLASRHTLSVESRGPTVQPLAFEFWGLCSRAAEQKIDICSSLTQSSVCPRLHSTLEPCAEGDCRPRSAALQTRRKSEDPPGTFDPVVFRTRFPLSFCTLSVRPTSTGSFTSGGSSTQWEVRGPSLKPSA